MTAKKCQKQAGTYIDQLEGGGFWGNGFQMKWRVAGVAVEYASAVWYPPAEPYSKFNGPSPFSAQAVEAPSIFVYLMSFDLL